MLLLAQLNNIYFFKKSVHASLRFGKTIISLTALKILINKGANVL